MDRRAFVASAGVIAGTAAASSLFATEDHGHHKSMNEKVAKKKWTKAEKDLIAATSSCEDTGKTCVSHCFELIAAGSMPMIDCQKTVLNMLTVAEALNTTLNYGTASSDDIKSLAKACKSFCQTCQKECKKHADHHEECKKCGESCEDCIKAIDVYLKA